MSPRSLPLLFAFALSTMTPAQPPKSLAAMRDHYRPLLIFSRNSGKMQTQLHLLTSQRSALIDRQIMLVPFPSLWASAVDHEIVALENEGDSWERFHVHPNDFTVILLGKDGGEKFRSHAPVTIDRLNRIIDAMPMRQAELHAKPPH